MSNDSDAVTHDLSPRNHPVFRLDGPKTISPTVLCNTKLFCNQNRTDRVTVKLPSPVNINNRSVRNGVENNGSLATSNIAVNVSQTLQADIPNNKEVNESISKPEFSFKLGDSV